MARVTVKPEEFTMVEFDPKRIASVAEEVAASVGLDDDVEIVVDVDQASPFGHIMSVIEDTTITIRAESAAFEDAKNPRYLSEEGTRIVLSRILFRVSDRFNDAFGDPPPDGELTYQQQTAWDAYALGRFERAGHDGEKPRRRYHFRLRHGFTDIADRVFERLWDSEDLTWDDIVAACDETAVARPEEDEPKGARAKAKKAKKAASQSR